MLRTFLTSTALLASFSVSAHDHGSEQASEIKPVRDYQVAAQSLLAQIEQKNSQGLESNALSVVQKSQPIIQQFIKKLPQCKEYLSAVSNAADVIPTLSLEEIETGYHADGKLPELKDGMCYHAKDLLVHAATVQAMAKMGINSEKGWTQAEDEIEEVLEHLEIVEIAYK